MSLKKLKKIRKKIPQKTIENVMHKADRKCCVCHKEIPGQIHHINGKPSDNREENLAWLCLKHHNEASTKSSISKCTLPPALVKKYKKEWEATVTKQRIKEFKEYKVETTENKNLYRHDIELTALEILSMKDSDTNRLEEKLQLLWHFALYKNYKDEVLNVCEKMLVTSGGSAVNKQELIGNFIPGLFVEMVPKITKWKNKIDDSRFKKAIDILIKIGVTNSTIHRNNKAFTLVCDGLMELFDILITYKKKHIAKKIAGAYKTLLSSSKETFKNLYDEKPFYVGIGYLTIIESKINEQIKENKVNWKLF